MLKKARLSKLFILLIFILVVISLILLTKDKGDFSLVIEDIKNLFR